MSGYHPEPYWSEVAQRIKSRAGINVLAGDDEPYYRYKRKRFLSLLLGLPFNGKSVLEIGHGPGGNLAEVYRHQPAQLHGVDISADMIALAGSHLPSSVHLHKINGTQLPFEDKTFDIVFSATVLQHNTDENMMKQLLTEMCRVSKDQVVLFERIESTIKGDDLCKGRPVSYYAELCASQGFELESTSFINIRVSYYVCGAIRKGLNPKQRKEGEPLNMLSLALQNLTLPITKVLDRIFPSQKDVGRLIFKRKK